MEERLREREDVRESEKEFKCQFHQQARFSYKIFGAKISNPKACFVIFGAKILYEKCARNTLMKLALLSNEAEYFYGYYL